MVMSVRDAVPYDDELLAEPHWQEQALDLAIRVSRVVRVFREPRWCVPTSLLAAGGVAAWMMVILFEHVPLGL
jgi:hypothetical protein